METSPLQSAPVSTVPLPAKPRPALKLVKTRRDGQQILYSLASDKVSRILVALYGIYCTTDAKPAA